MKYDPHIASVICVNAPDAIADLILNKKVSLLKDRLPGLHLCFNSQVAPVGSAQVTLGFAANIDPDVISRKIGTLSSRTYRHHTKHDLHVLPDIIAGLDPDYCCFDITQKPIIDELWLSINRSVQHLPGCRQTLDWVESCLSSLFWLNETELGEPALS